MTVHNIRDYIAKHPGKKPPQISFHASTYQTMDDKDKRLNIAVRVENGDVEGILKSVIENGRIAAEEENGTLLFIPWPCAAVEIKDL